MEAEVEANTLLEIQLNLRDRLAARRLALAERSSLWLHALNTPYISRTDPASCIPCAAEQRMLQ